MNNIFSRLSVYIERNPVRAGMVEKAADYPWSSASAHCGLKDDDILGKKEDWGSMFVSTDDWPGWLAVGERKRVSSPRQKGDRFIYQIANNQVLR